jgi:hypothetical protein
MVAYTRNKEHFNKITILHKMSEHRTIFIYLLYSDLAFITISSLFNLSFRDLLPTSTIRAQSKETKNPLFICTTCIDETHEIYRGGIRSKTSLAAGFEY